MLGVRFGPRYWLCPMWLHLLLCKLHIFAAAYQTEIISQSDRCASSDVGHSSQCAYIQQWCLSLIKEYRATGEVPVISRYVRY